MPVARCSSSSPPSVPFALVAILLRRGVKAMMEAYRIPRRCANVNEGNLMTVGWVRTWAASLLISVAALAAMAPSRAQFAKLPEGPNRELGEVVGGRCHGTELVAISGR